MLALVSATVLYVIREDDILNFFMLCRGTTMIRHGWLSLAMLYPVVYAFPLDFLIFFLYTDVSPI